MHVLALELKIKGPRKCEGVCPKLASQKPATRCTACFNKRHFMNKLRAREEKSLLEKKDQKQQSYTVNKNRKLSKKVKY